MTQLYEIVETADGEYILRRADSDEQPVVVIRFSDQATAFLDGARGEVAKTMMEAGISRVEAMVEEEGLGSVIPVSIPAKVIH